MGAYVPYNETQETFINNFYCRFPSRDGTVYAEGLTRAALRDTWQVVRVEALRVDFEGRDDFEDYCSKYSDLYLGQTPEQFFAVVDAVVLGLGLSPEVIAEKIRASHHADIDIAQMKVVERDTYLHPVYVSLRKRGYNVKELWG